MGTATPFLDIKIAREKSIILCKQSRLLWVHAEAAKEENQVMERMHSLSSCEEEMHRRTTCVLSLRAEWA